MSADLASAVGTGDDGLLALGRETQDDTTTVRKGTNVA